jgi:hypothetical protein
MSIKGTAELRVISDGHNNIVEATVPNGTRLADAIKLHATISDKVLKNLRGCGACISGAHIIIRERLDDIIKVDLDKMEVIR